VSQQLVDANQLLLTTYSCLLGPTPSEELLPLLLLPVRHQLNLHFQISGFLCRITSSVPYYLPIGSGRITSAQSLEFSFFSLKTISEIHSTFLCTNLSLGSHPSHLSRAFGLLSLSPSLCTPPLSSVGFLPSKNEGKALESLQAVQKPKGPTLPLRRISKQ
jgi:hypothetical protein